VVAASIHAPIGLRNILREWANWRGRSLDVAMVAFSLLLLALGLRAAFAVYAA
jgi:fumarate reductase subunit C